MAFSTQKDFMKVEFLADERTNKDDGKEYRASLKTYLSCTDSRAWSLSQERQTKYLQDWVVSSGMRFNGDGGGDGSEENLFCAGHKRKAQDLAGKKTNFAEEADGAASTSRRKSLENRDENLAGYSGGLGGKDTGENDEFGPETTWSGTVSGNPEYSDLKAAAPGRGILPQQAVKPSSRKPGISLPTRASSTGSGRVVVVAPVVGIKGTTPLDEDSIYKRRFGDSSDDLKKPKLATGASGAPGSVLSDSQIVGGSASGVESMASGQRPTSALSGDSLIEAACIKLDKINAVVRENGELKKQLNYSKEKLESLTEENTQIKAIISETNAGSLTPIEDELKVLNAKGDFNPESVLKVLKSYINDIKSYNQKAAVIMAENESLKKQLAKLERRVEITPLPTKQDVMSTDVTQLQLTVNDLRNEVVKLRAIEEDRAQLQVEFDKLKKTIKGIGSPDELYKLKKNTVALHEVQCDRDRLRNLINSMMGIENEIRIMKQRAEKTEQLEMQLAALRNGPPDGGFEGGRTRDSMQSEIEQLRKEKEDAQRTLESVLPPGTDADRLQDQLKDYNRVSCELNMYKVHYNVVMNELRQVSARLLQLEPELEESRRRLSIAESAISSYERQMDELMEVIIELEGNSQLFDEQRDSSPADEEQDVHVQDLLAIAKIIILYIQKETEARKNLEEQLKACKNEISQLSEIGAINKGDDMELAKLRKELDACRKNRDITEEENKKLRSQISVDDMEDLLDQLNACKRENQRLQAIAGESLPKESKNFDDIFDELNKCRAQMSANSEEKGLLSAEVDRLKQLLDACRSDHDTFAAIEEKQSVLETFQGRIAELEEQVAILTGKLEGCLKNCANEVSGVKKQLSEDKASLGKQLELAYEKQDDDRENGMHKLSKCEEELAKLKEEFKQSVAMSKAENEGVQQQMRKLDTEKSSLGKDEAVVSEAVKCLEKLLAECRDENKRLKTEQAGLHTQWEASQTEINKLQKDAEEEKTKLNMELTKATHEVKQLNSALTLEKQGSKIFAEDCESIRASLRELTDNYKQLESRYDSLQRHDASIQQALDDLRKEYEVQTLQWTKEINEQKGLLEQAKASLETQRTEISRLNNVLKQSAGKDIEDQLASIIAENNRLKSENGKLKETAESKEKEIGQLKQKVSGIATDLDKYSNELKTTDCTEYINEIDKLKNQIATHLEEIKSQGNLLNGLRNEVNAAKAAKSELEHQLAKLKSDKELANEQVKSEASKQQPTKAVVETSAAKENEELTKCLAEKNRLQEENRRLQEEFKQLENLVKDIEEERKKNKQLEGMIEDFEKKINDLQNQPTAVGTPKDLTTESIVGKLKEQLQNETNKNNALEAELQSCKAAMNELQRKLEIGKHGVESDKKTLETTPFQPQGAKLDESQLQEGRKEIPPQGAREGDTSAMFTSTISEIKTSHCENLEKMQKMYEERMQEMMKNHEREIKSLRLTNEALQKMLEDIKAQISALGGTVAIEPKKDDHVEKADSLASTCAIDKKLKKICTKIIKTSIDCLSLRELKYLHCAVYRAGVKMKPAAEVMSADDINRCCECTGFICCLPSIPKEAERKLMERINCLENELEHANGVLARMRDQYESKSDCNKRCCSDHSDRGSAPPHSINDAVNQILKCAREGKRTSQFGLNS